MATTGRWKANSDGTGYYDPNDSGPDQYTPTAEQQQQQQTQYGQTQQGQQPPGVPADASKVPAYPYLMSGQQGWPDMSQWYTPHQQPSQNEGMSYPQVMGPNGETPQQWASQQAGEFWKNFQGGVTGGGTAPYQTTTVDPAQTRPAGPPPGGYAPMEGIDTNKLNDPNHTTPKYVASRILASGGSLADAAAAVGGRVLDQEKMELPGGIIIDTRRDIEGDNALQWLVQYDPAWEDPSHGSGRTNGLTGGGGTGTGFGVSTAGLSGGIGGNTGVGGAFNNTQANTLWGMLMGRATQGLNIDPKDPIIAAQTNSFRAEQERAARNNIAAQAEAQGPTANLTSERRLESERAAQATGGLRAQLMQSELTARRGEIQNALTQMGSMLSDQQRMALQRELGLIDANLRQQQITNQNNQFLDQFGLSATQAANYWDALRSGLING